MRNEELQAQKKKKELNKRMEIEIVEEGRTEKITTVKKKRGVCAKNKGYFHL